MEAIKALEEFLMKDDSDLNRYIKGDVKALNQQIKDWGESGAFKKSYVKKLITEEKNKIMAKYKESLKAQSEYYKEKRQELKRKYENDIRKEPAYYQYLRDQERFKASMLSKEELKSRIGDFISTKNDYEKVNAFKDFDEMAAIFQEARARGIDDGMIVQSYNVYAESKIEPYEMKYKESVAYKEAADYYENIESNTIVVSVDRAGTTENMLIPLDQVIDTTPLDTLTE